MLEARDLVVPGTGLEAFADTTAEVEAQERLSRHAFGAQFVEERVADTFRVVLPTQHVRPFAG